MLELFRSLARRSHVVQHMISAVVTLGLAAVVCGSASCGGPSPATIPGTAGPAPPEPDPRGRRPPHVLLVVLDTTRGDHCSLLGHDRPTTPRLDAIAEEGTSYRNAWVPGGWTAPVHASLFTGMRAEKHGMRGDGAVTLRQSVVTLAEMLRDAGYRTAAFSGNPVVSPAFGLDQGFQTAPAIHLDRTRPLPWARDANRRALEFLRAADEAGEPALVYVNSFEPHMPYEPPEEFQKKFLPTPPNPSVLEAARAWTLPASLELLLGLSNPSLEILACLPSLYDGEIATIDAELGTLFDNMRAAGLLDSTLVIVTSDHGENLGDHGLWDHKFSLHRSIRRVPLVVREPGGRAQPRVIDDVVRIEDVLPTVLEACGVAVPADLDGKSLRGDTRGRISRASWSPHLHALSGMRRRYPSLDDTLFRSSFRAAFDGRHHLIARSDGKLELYDVTADPGETTDLSQVAPDVVERMTQLLDHWE